MKPMEKTANDLFQILRTRFSPVTLGDENAEVTSDPAQARFFSFVYTENDKPMGTVSVSIISNRSLKVYYSHNMVQNIKRSSEWYALLKELRFFAKQNLLSFDARDIQKDQLDTRDFNFIKTNDGPYKESDVELAESTMYGSKRKSMQRFENATLVVYHKKSVDEEKRGARSRHIESIFIESNHERFRFPINYLNGARAMAVHVSEGGTPYDAIGQHIVGTVTEMQNLAKFARMTRRHAMEDSEADEIRNRVIETYGGIKRDIMRMQNVVNYRNFAETFEPAEASGTADVTTLQEKFTRKVWNEQMNDLLPSVLRALEARKVVDEADDYTNQSYFEKVASELGSILGKSVTLQDYDEGDSYRDMNFVIDGEPVELFQNWKEDGSSGKPVTHLGDENLGRFAIWWNNPRNYANDLASVLSDNDTDLDEADIDENAFNQAAAAAARAGESEFEFNGKTYKTKMDKDTAEKIVEAPARQARGLESFDWPDPEMAQHAENAIRHGMHAYDAFGHVYSMTADHRDWMQNNKDELIAMFARYGLATESQAEEVELDEASPSVEKTIKNPNFKLILKKDDAADRMIRTTKFTRADGLLSYIMSDIASRMIGDGADAVANFASEMSINIGDEGASFGTKITPEYKRDKQLAMMLAKRYLDDIKQMATDSEYESTVRKDPKEVYGAKKKRTGGTHESVEAAFEDWANEVFEGKWDYPKDITGSKPDVYWDQGNTRKKAARKEHRKKIKAKAHKDLMKGKQPSKDDLDEATMGTVGTTGTAGTATPNDARANQQVIKALSGGDAKKAQDIKRISDKLARGQRLTPNEQPIAGEIAKNVMTTKKPAAAMQALAQDEYTDMDRDDNLYAGSHDDYEEENSIKDAIIYRLSVRHNLSDLLKTHGLDRVEAAIDDVADFHSDTDELGSSDISVMAKQVLDSLTTADESVVVEKTLRVKADNNDLDDGATDTQMGTLSVDSDEERKKRAQAYRDKKSSSVEEEDDYLVRESLSLLKRYAGI
jgi:hypothetical protein